MTAISAPHPSGSVVSADRRLSWATAAFALAVVLHNFDHVRRGADTIEADVFWAGTLAVAVEGAVVLWACQRHRWAALAAAAAGPALALGYVVVHFLPARSWLSDSLPSGESVSALTWAAASLEVVAAVALGVVGWQLLRDRGGLASAARPTGEELPLSSALRHPLVLGFFATQVVVLVLSFAQR